MYITLEDGMRDSVKEEIEPTGDGAKQPDTAKCANCGEGIYRIHDAWLKRMVWWHFRNDSPACRPTYAAPTVVVDGPTGECER